jgi:arylesterase/paraoxonase
MRFLKKTLLLIFLVLIVFIVHVVVSTGYFRTIENTFDGEVVKKITLAGAEDITVSIENGFALISATARKKLPVEEEEFGGLYFMDLKTEVYSLKKLTVDFKKSFAPHGLSMLKTTDSTFKVMTVNHTPQGESLEIFHLENETLTHTTSLIDDLIYSPNDVVMIDENRFYFTNDHKYTDGLGRLLEDYGGLSVSTIIYFDGENYTEVANNIAYANGINYDSKRKLLFVASPRKFLIKVYAKNDDGSLNFIEDIDCGTGVDNIEFDSDGILWIGAHPNLLRFASYAKGAKATAPSEIIKINYRGKNDYSIDIVYLNDGSEMSASTVAAPYKDMVISGNVMDAHFLVLKPN